jgi:hypothetical protein
MGLNRREIPRFARNDKINYFFRSLFGLPQFSSSCKLKTQQAEACSTLITGNSPELPQVVRTSRFSPRWKWQQKRGAR